MTNLATNTASWHPAVRASQTHTAMNTSAQISQQAPQGYSSTELVNLKGGNDRFTFSSPRKFATVKKKESYKMYTTMNASLQISMQAPQEYSLTEFVYSEERCHRLFFFIAQEVCHSGEEGISSLQ